MTIANTSSPVPAESVETTATEKVSLKNESIEEGPVDPVPAKSTETAFKSELVLKKTEEVISEGSSQPEVNSEPSESKSSQPEFISKNAEEVVSEDPSLPEVSSESSKTKAEITEGVEKVSEIPPKDCADKTLDSEEQSNVGKPSQGDAESESKTPVCAEIVSGDGSPDSKIASTEANKSDSKSVASDVESPKKRKAEGSESDEQSKEGGTPPKVLKTSADSDATSA